ncbi:leucine-rich repeat-containing protein 74B isoform X1 [Pleurodeles waltl]|uniref:leucine-rich repeat-containing protein 74B isoform X1 n=1 Tax=Pleurodeles waltl TaxID=8319 RepID=UPI003709BCBC
MVLSRKIPAMLPSVQEAGDAEQGEEEEAHTRLGGIESRPPSRPLASFSRGSVHSSKTVSRSAGTRSTLSAGSTTSKASRAHDAVEETEEEQQRQTTRRSPSEESELVQESEEGWDTDVEIEETKKVYDPTGKEKYLEACQAYGVVPISYFLRHMKDSELIMMHHGLGPQGAKALSLALVTNTFIVKLNLSDNSLEGEGAAAIAEMLKDNCYITEIDLSSNRLGFKGARVLSAMLFENTSLRKLNLSGNGFNDQMASFFAEALMNNQKVESLDLSHNMFGGSAGETLGVAIAENTGMKELNFSWNYLRGKGAIAFAKGLGANIFLQVLDLSYNGFSNEGAAVLGDALKVNNVLEELNISNNRISLEGAISLALGLKENKTLRVLGMARNPMKSEGCFGILKAIQANRESAIEALDFSDITVNKEFEDLYNTVKSIIPNLTVQHGGNTVLFKKDKPKADPLTKLKNHLIEKSLRLVDFFVNVDEDKSTLINRLEFQQGLLKAGIPLSQDELQQLMDSLDKDKNGEIDFSELVFGVTTP